MAAITEPRVSADGIEAMRRRLEELEITLRSRDEFLGKLSHDVVNLFLPFQLVLQILQQPEPDMAALRQTRDLLEEYVPAVTRLVEQLRGLSRMLRGKLAVQSRPVELTELIRQAEAKIQRLPAKHRNHLSVTLPEEPVWTAGDSNYLRQVVDELLDNAVKFTPAGGQIDVSLDREEGVAVVGVRDSGRGISADFLPRVFDLFVQEDPLSGGWGLGLSLAQRIVELHGGCMDAHSEGPGRGSRFLVRLPVAEQPQGPSHK
jgi:signal transduction histidine kinase